MLSYTGTEGKSSGEQLQAVLAWLPNALESEEGHEFLGSIGNLEGNDKADALDAGARKVGLSDCPLALLWRQ
ncbi:MAG: hypothetical protein R3B48_14440 [Kofleriaceae bacterium]